MVAVLIVCEDSAHAALIDALVRRRLCALARARGADWLADRFDEQDTEQIALSWEGDGAGYVLRWLGEETLDELGQDRPRVRYTTKVQASRMSEAFTINGRRPRLSGFLEDGPAKPEAHLWRRKLLWAYAEHDTMDAIVIGYDTDGDPMKLEGLKQAIRVTEWARERVVIAAPHQDAEAWFVAGFQPDTADERARLTSVSNDLGFNPCTEPTRLTAQPNDAPADAKRVLRRLVFDENRSKPPRKEELRELVDRCLADLGLLEARQGEATGIDALFEEVEALLYPLVS